MIASAQPFTSSMAPDEGGSCVASARPKVAAAFGQLGARISLQLLYFQQSGKLWCQQRRARGTDVTVRADRPILQIIANKMSILHWLRTLSQVRCGLQACHISLVMQPKATTPGPASR